MPEAGAAIAELEPRELTSIYRDVLAFRRFEEAAARAYGSGKIQGFCHLHIGQEAVSVGLGRGTRPDDIVISGYRIHTMALAKGVPAQKVMDELFGRATGTTGGVGGSMHIFDVARGFWGGWGLVGQQVPMAAGVAFAQRYRGTGRVTVVCFGDGAVQQGALTETLNLASLHSLPLVFLLENNGYGMGTAVGRITTLDPMHSIAEPWGVASAAVDGMDPLAMVAAVRSAVERARNGGGPFFLEARCSRFRGHSMSDPGRYRSREELELEKARDPLVRMEAILRERVGTSDAEFERMDDEVKREMQDVLERAEQAPWPDEEAIHRHVHGSGGP